MKIHQPPVRLHDHLEHLARYAAIASLLDLLQDSARR